jgi:hypothetical protein
MTPATSAAQNAEDHRERHGTCPRREREKPCRRGRRVRDRGNRRHRSLRRQPTGADLLGDPHRGRDAIHVHAGRIGRDLVDQSAVVVLGLKAQLAPARHDLGAQSERAAELLGRGHRLLGRLAVDVKNAGGGEDEVRPFLRRHERVPPSAASRAANSPSQRRRPRAPE